MAHIPTPGVLLPVAEAYVPILSASIKNDDFYNLHKLPPTTEIANRPDNVLHVIYLLFSEGYYSKTQNQILRKDLCLEALRLGLLLTQSMRQPEIDDFKFCIIQVAIVGC